MRRGAPREAELAAAYLQKARETGDPSFYARADGVLRRALGARPGGSGRAGRRPPALAAGRHDFRGALRCRAGAARAGAGGDRRATRSSSTRWWSSAATARPSGRSSAWSTSSPTSPAYARVSYFRELTGDLDRRRRGAAPGRSPPAARCRENVAYVQSLLGSLELSPRPARRRPAGVRRGARRGAGLRPGARRPRPPRRPGRRPRRRDRRAGAGSWRGSRCPSTSIALGEAELAAGRLAAGREDLALVRVQERLLAAAGVNTDVELAIFEADHGDRAAGPLRLAREAWANAPERPLGRRARLGADALRPAARRACAGRAGRCGSARSTRPSATTRASPPGRGGRRDLRLALRHGLDAHPLHAQRARAALEALR